MAGGGVALIGITLIPLLSGLFGYKLRAADAAHTYCSNLPWLTVSVLVERIFKPYILSKGDASMNFLTNLIFVLNLLKTLINHFF